MSTPHHAEDWKKNEQTCRHCCGKCCSSPEQSRTPAPGRKRRRSVWLRPSRPAEKEPGEQCSGRDSGLQSHKQHLSAGLVMGLDGAVGLAIQPTGVVRTQGHPITRATGTYHTGCWPKIQGNVWANIWKCHRSHLETCSCVIANWAEYI